MAKLLSCNEPAVRIELTTAHIIDAASPSNCTSASPSVAGSEQRRNSGEAAPERREVPNDRPTAAWPEIGPFVWSYTSKCRRRPRQPEESDQSFAWRVYKAALRVGALKRGPCVAAGPECSGRIAGHHHDYTKPLDVVWCCAKHHGVLDRARRVGASLPIALLVVTGPPAARPPHPLALRAGVR